MVTTNKNSPHLRHHDQLIAALKEHSSQLADLTKGINDLNFFPVCHALFVELERRESDFKDFSSSEENNVIYKLLDSLVKHLNTFSQVNTISASDKRDLKCIHSTMVSMFGLGSTLEKRVDQRVDAIAEARCNSSQLFSTRKTEQLKQLVDINWTDIKPLVQITDKLLRYENHLAIFKIHAAKSTTPQSLFFNRFPRPFFAHDQAFVDKQNKLILEYQEKTVALIKATLEDKITELQSQLSSLKSSFVDKPFITDSQIDIDLLSKYIYGEVESDYKQLFIKNKSRADRCISRPFVAKKVPPAPSSKSDYSTAASFTTLDSDISTFEPTSTPASSRSRFVRRDTPRPILKHNNYNTSDHSFRRSRFDGSPPATDRNDTFHHHSGQRSRDVRQRSGHSFSTRHSNFRSDHNEQHQQSSFRQKKLRFNR